MEFSVVIKEVRQTSYMSQQEFASELGISFSTVNRWETGKAIPNYQTMKRILAYCKRAGVQCDTIESAWKEKKNGINTY